MTDDKLIQRVDETYAKMEKLQNEARKLEKQKDMKALKIGYIEHQKVALDVDKTNLLMEMKAIDVKLSAIWEELKEMERLQ